MDDAVGAGLGGLQPDLGAAGAEADPVPQHPDAVERGLHPAAALQDAAGDARVHAGVVVLRLDTAAEDGPVALRQDVGGLGGVLVVVREEVHDARVLHDHQLAAHRVHVRVGDEFAGAGAGAVDDHARAQRRVGQGADRTALDPYAELVEPVGQPLEVARHVDHRDRVAPPGGEAGRE